MPKQSAADAFVQLYARDIRENPDAYKRGVVADPEGTARRIIDGLGDADARRLLAESEREHQDAWREGSNAARLKEEANEAKERARTLIRELRTIRDQVTPGATPTLCASIRASIKDALRTWADNSRKASELIDAFDHLPAFKEGLAEG